MWLRWQKIHRGYAIITPIEIDNTTGKELIARLIHIYNSSSMKPLIDIYCRPLPEIPLEYKMDHNMIEVGANELHN